MKGLIFTYALVLLGIVGGLYRPVIGLYVYLAFSILRPDFLWYWAGGMGSISLYVGVAMLVGWALRGFGTWRFERMRWAVIAFIGFVIWNAISSMQAVNPESGWNAVVELLKILAPFMVGVTSLRGEKDARTLIWVMVACQGYVALEINRSYLAGFNRVQEIGFGSMDNNSFGVSLVTSVGLALGLVLSTRQLWLKGLAAVAAILIVNATLLTFSRGAMLGLFIAMAIAALLVPKRPRYVVAMLLALAVVVRLTGPQVWARFQTTFKEEENLDFSAKSRLDLWQDCLTAAVENPLLGVGPMNWRVVSVNYGWPIGKEAHSTWMQALAELGFPGFSLLVMFYGIAMLRLWPLVWRRNARDAPTRALMATGIISGLVGFVVAGQFVSMPGLETPYYVVMAAVVLTNGPAMAVAQARAVVIASAPAQPMARRHAFRPGPTMPSSHGG